MKHTNKKPALNYFEDVYLGKSKNEISIKESKRLQKLLGAKALKNSGAINTSDLKRISANKPKPKAIMDFDNFLLPFNL